MSEGLQPSFEAIYYGLFTLRAMREPPFSLPLPFIFECVRDFYVPEKGYYLAEGEGHDAVDSTFMAMRIDSLSQTRLNQPVNTSWMISHSLLNPAISIESSDMVHQYKIFWMLHRLFIRTEPERLSELRSTYKEFVCEYQISGEEDWLEIKFIRKLLKDDMQITCPNEEDKGVIINKLNSLKLENEKDIKRLYWLCYLRGNYGLEINNNEFFSQLEKFSTRNGGYKEYLEDDHASLKGTYYAQQLLNFLRGPRK